jgi:Asp-tRNA(Asn)/Glu-tRNA(Gln) amidotransferase A subunit family amidase
MQDIWRLSAADLASLIRSKKVSAKEAATAALARLDAVNPKINAVVDHKPAEVLAQASAIDAAIGRGEDAGPLAGVPVTVKVNIDQEGFATTNGLKLQRDVIAKGNSPVIDNLRKAGAVILGRTNCPAFSYRWFTTNLVHGDTKNPRDPGITPGGSSGGAGAAVAAGIGHIAHGTDIAGSIRYPAYAMACMACGRRWAASQPSMRRCPSVPSVPRCVQCRVPWRARSPIYGLRWLQCRAGTREIPGGCRRRWKARRCRSASPCVSIPMDSIPCRK